MSARVANPGCGRECRLDREHGFLVEASCPVHAREGYTPFKVFFLAENPCLVGTLSLCYGEGSAHEHVICASFIMGLN